MRDLFLGVDIGTSSSRGVLVDAQGRVLARAGREHPTSRPHPGWHEHDAESAWWGDLQYICRRLPAGELARVAGVAVSGIGPCLLPTDADFTPLRPAILYGVDTRAAAEIRELDARYGSEQVLRRSGSPLTSQAVGPKLLWLRRHEPEVWARTTRVLTASSFLVGRLTGEYLLDHHTASQWVPLYDLEQACWIEDVARELAPGLALPRLAWPGEEADVVTREAAAATGLAAGIPVLAGTVDAWAEALSVGVTRPGDLMLMYGTTMFMVGVADAGLRDPRLWAARGLFPGSFTAAAGMATSGALTAWLRELAGGVAYELLIAEAASTPAGAEGLVALPYFEGERTPLFDERARGAIFGLSLRHTRGHLYRALLEATGFGVRHNLEALAAAGFGLRRAVAVGGGTAGGLWTQVVSDITGQVQELPAELSGACYGDALLVALAAGAAAEPADWVRPGRSVVPDPRHADLYDRLYGIYRELYPATRHLAHELADLQSPPAGGRDRDLPAPDPEAGDAALNQLGAM